jgi:circadian clock protein KaiB
MSDPEGSIVAEQDMLEAAADGLPPTLLTWQLCLYVAGSAPKSLTALANLKDLCETHLAGRYEIEVVDLLEQPLRASSDEIIAVPTVVRQRPEPVRKVIGDLSDTDSVLVGLRLPKRF